MTTTVICAYHDGAKPEFNQFILDHPGVFLPVLGGSCYYKQGTNEFYDKLTRDDTGENISNLVTYVNEHTPLYWAYKHYREIGNPDMIGLCHYRRFMDVDYEHLDSTKIYANRVHARHAAGICGLIADSVRGTYSNFCSEELVDLYLDAYRNALPEYNQYLDIVLEDSLYYAKNMFIMSRADFMDFMAYVCRVMRVLFDDTNYDEASSIFYPKLHVRRLMLIYSRCRGFLMEMFVSVWLERQYQLRRNVVPAKVLEFV